MAANFDPLARVYRYLEHLLFGRALWRRRIAFLPQLAGCRRVLMLGEGDGRFLQAFLDCNREAVVDSIDASAQMLALARHRIGTHADRVHFLQADLSSGPSLPATYDTVITHFLLDCFTDSELAQLVPRIGSALTPDARWIVSEFRNRGPIARLLLPPLYLFFGWTTGLKTRRLPDYHQTLTNNGFHLVEAEQALAGLLVSEVWKR